MRSLQHYLCFLKNLRRRTILLQFKQSQTTPLLNLLEFQNTRSRLFILTSHRFLRKTSHRGTPKELGRNLFSSPSRCRTCTSRCSHQNRNKNKNYLSKDNSNLDNISLAPKRRTNLNNHRKLNILANRDNSTNHRNNLNHNNLNDNPNNSKSQNSRPTRNKPYNSRSKRRRNARKRQRRNIFSSC